MSAIASGFIQEGFKVKMEELKERKSELEFKQVITQIVTEEDVRKLLNLYAIY